MPRVLLALSVALAFSSHASAAETIPDVKTLEDLQKVAPIKVGDDWEVRLGLGDGGEEAGAWKLLYCLAKYVGPAKDGEIGFQSPGWPPTGQRLGPVSFEVLPEGAEVKYARQDMQLGPTPANREGVYVGVAPLAREGRFEIRVFNPRLSAENRNNTLAARAIAVERQPSIAWMKFAQQARGNEQEYVVSADPTPFVPQFDGLAPVYPRLGWQEKVSAKADGTPLPGKIPTDLTWESLVRPPGAERRGVKVGETEVNGLALSLEKGLFVVRSDVKMNHDVDERLLARWWINGKPVEWGPDQGGIERAARELARRADPVAQVRVAFSLPFPDRVRPGDKVGVQVLYSPGTCRYAGTAKCWAGDAWREYKDQALVPLLSNRLEFEVNAEMLAGRRP